MDCQDLSGVVIEDNFVLIIMLRLWIAGWFLPVNALNKCFCVLKWYQRGAALFQIQNLYYIDEVLIYIVCMVMIYLIYILCMFMIYLLF